MPISIIVAASENNIIGKNNQLVWKLPEDTLFFRNMTWGLPIVMGRKSFEALGSKPLPGRINIVVSRKGIPVLPAGVRSASGLDDALRLARETECREIFIGGGGEIYRQAMDVTDRIYMTRVHAVLDGDARFPEIDPDVWQLDASRPFAADARHAYSFTIETWTRKRP